MSTHSAFDYRPEKSAHEAFEIAWSFLRAADELGDETVAQAFIAEEIIRLLRRGERHRIRLANLTIATFQRTRPADRASVLGWA